MNILEAIQQRHSVRSYLDQPLSEAVQTELRQEIALCNQEGGLHMQLLTDEPQAFSNFLAHYGKFSAVKNYIAMIGPKSVKLDEKLGYYGERLALKAQMLGLNSCWVALTFSKRKCAAVRKPGEKLVCVLALGYGSNPGTAHKSKAMDEVCEAKPPLPTWFKSGVEAALLAPSATNQQKFKISLEEDEQNSQPGVRIISTGGFYANVDLGIVKYHFEMAAGSHNFRWV